MVSAPLAGRLQRVVLREGDTVAAGAALTLAPVLSPMLDERTLREQRARIGATEAAVQRAGSRIEAARVALEQAHIDLRRTTNWRARVLSPPPRWTPTGSPCRPREGAGHRRDSQHISRHDLEQARAALIAVRDPACGTATEGFVVRSPVAGGCCVCTRPANPRWPWARR